LVCHFGGTVPVAGKGEHGFRTERHQFGVSWRGAEQRNLGRDDARRQLRQATACGSWILAANAARR